MPNVFFLILKKVDVRSAIQIQSPASSESKSRAFDPAGQLSHVGLFTVK